MAFQLENSEPLDKGIKRIGKEALNKAIKALQDENEPHEGIHDARKKLKKLRALIRICRDELGLPTYKQYNIFFRDVAKSLSGIRDFTSMVESIHSLQKTNLALGKEAILEKTGNLLEDRRDEAAENFFENETLVPRVIHQLSDTMEKVENWPLEGIKRKILVKGLTRVYRRGYNGYKNAYNNLNEENLHEWRKRVKYLFYQCKLIINACPEMIGPYSEGLNYLSDCLGDNHDLELLLHTLAENQLDLSSERTSLMKQLVFDRKHQLQKEAFNQGFKLYSEKPKVFARRIDDYLSGWEEVLIT